MWAISSSQLRLTRKAKMGNYKINMRIFISLNGTRAAGVEANARDKSVQYNDCRFFLLVSCYLWLFFFLSFFFFFSCFQLAERNNEQFLSLFTIAFVRVRWIKMQNEAMEGEIVEAGNRNTYGIGVITSMPRNDADSVVGIEWQWKKK